MTRPTGRLTKRLNIQILVGLIGFTLSILLHELFHIIVHWNHIQHVSLFPNFTTIIQIDTMLPTDYDIDGEEIVAYGITLLVMIITVMIIYKIRDTDDTRSAEQILFPEDRAMQKLTNKDLPSMLDIDQQTPKKRPRRPPQR